ncbi:unnamed protein product [Phytophthora lilii]|uniref:Unnamed protein product n=1 Tax=Phytophthora lilii TaxID=2077276 RepID=A0A9W6TUT8_9STRA|nr:unnamed protein product [Phytophthora lilii]
MQSNRNPGWSRIFISDCVAIFVAMRLGHVDRARAALKTLQEMIARVIRAFDIKAIRKILDQTLSNNVKTVWHMEFYKAVHRCTPNTFLTFATVGACWIESCIDCTVDSINGVWGIELLHDGIKLDECLDRFAPDGLYSRLELSDYCLVDFRCIASMDIAPGAVLAEDLNLCEQLYIVYYDAEPKHVSLVNSQLGFRPVCLL